MVLKCCKKVCICLNIVDLVKKWPLAVPGDWKSSIDQELSAASLEFTAWMNLRKIFYKNPSSDHVITVEASSDLVINELYGLTIIWGGVGLRWEEIKCDFNVTTIWPAIPQAGTNYSLYRFVHRWTISHNRGKFRDKKLCHKEEQNCNDERYLYLTERAKGRLIYKYKVCFFWLGFETEIEVQINSQVSLRGGGDVKILLTAVIERGDNIALCKQRK